jgi:hypothetical protein
MQQCLVQAGCALKEMQMCFCAMRLFIKVSTTSSRHVAETAWNWPQQIPAWNVQVSGHDLLQTS